MKPGLLGVLAATALIAPGAVAAQSDQESFKGLYFDIRGGASSLSDADNSGSGITSDIVIESEFDTGYVLDGAVGYAHPSGLRGEIALGFRSHDIDTLTITNDGGVGVFLGVGSLNGLSTSDVDGDVRTVSLMANGFYEFDVGSGFKPFVGAGAGAAFLDVEAALVGVTIVDDDDTVFAYQGMAGVSYQISPDLSLSLLYNYFATADPSFSDAAGGSFDSEYDSHNIMVGLRFMR